MNFRDEYKKEISEISPDEAALERIRIGVAKRLAEPEITKKKPLPLRRIAVIGGSAAACLVIGVTAIALTGGKHFSDTANNMMVNAPSAGANGGNMAGGANDAPNPNMSSRPNINDDVNESDRTYQGGMPNTESVMGNDGYGDTVGEFSPDTAIPAGGAEAQEPSSTAAARITLDGDMLTLRYNGETTVFMARSSDSDSIDKGSETGELGIRPIGPAENAERIEVISSNGERMFLELRDDEAVLFNSENEVLEIYVRVE